MPIRLAGALVAVGAMAVVGAAGPAGAVDDTKPTACNGLHTKDPNGDQVHLQVPEAERTKSTEITGSFIKYDAAKGAEATTANIVVAEFKPEIPDGWTTQSWVHYYTPKDGTVHFVRAWLDFAGGTAFEYGVFTPNPTGVVLTGVSQVQGTTQGKFFEGADGVIQLVIPADQVKAGDALEAVYASSAQGRTAPATTQSPNRGLSHVLDSSPDDGADANAKATVSPCAGGGGGGGGATPTPTPGGGGGSGGGGAKPNPPAGPGTRALPVTLVTKSVKAKKVKKSLKLKLKSPEKLTTLGAQLRKGKKVFGTGKLATLNKTGSMTLKVKKLKKGSYILDLAGNDASGKRLITSLKLKVK